MEDNFPVTSQDMTPVLLGGARTPFTKYNGVLAGIPAHQLGAHAISAALERTGVPAESVDQVILGHVIQAGAGQGPARQASIGAGIGWDVPAVTINKLCLSGLTAVIDAARLIRSGEAEVVVAGGQESMSNAPHLLLDSRRPKPLGGRMLEDSLNYDGLRDPFDRKLMGRATDDGNAVRDISRARQDEFAALSHQRATATREVGGFDAEIAPFSVRQRKGEDMLVTADDGIRPGTTVETLAALKPAFNPEAGTVTAGNASQVTDGAAAVVLASKGWALRNGVDWLAEVGASGQVAGPDGSLHSQPSAAILQAIGRQGIKVADLDLIEINEAFASVVVQSADDLGIDPAVVNAQGGAIALGHPVGASGARLALHLALELNKRDGGIGVAALCGGGGQGEALILIAK